MKDNLYLVFKQKGECATREDKVVAYIIGSDSKAQEECNRRNKKGKAYYYFMNAEEVKKEGTKI